MKQNTSTKMGWRVAGVLLIVAASLYWVAWLLMPAPGITDAQTILDLVAAQRTSVGVSILIQLVAAVLYVPALTGIVIHSSPRLQAALWWPVSVFLLGILGYVADVVIHMLAYGMTAPHLDPVPFVPVMAFMQGPVLIILSPLILAYFVGGGWLSGVLAREGVVSPWNPRLYLFFLAIGAVAALFARGGVAPELAAVLSPRLLGMISFACVCAAQIWVGVALWNGRGRQVTSSSNVELAGSLT